MQEMKCRFKKQEGKMSFFRDGTYKLHRPVSLSSMMAAALPARYM